MAFAVQINAPSTQAKLPGVVPGTLTLFKVTAINELGASEALEKTTVLTPDPVLSKLLE